MGNRYGNDVSNRFWEHVLTHVDAQTLYRMSVRVCDQIWERMRRPINTSIRNRISTFVWRSCL